MREILFRGKRTDNGEWIYGDLMQNVDCIKIREQEKSIKKIAKSYEVDPETVGQCTGLCDKNGKKIFEGDILGLDCEAFKEVHTVVDYDEELTAIVTTYNVIVIGNIHDKKLEDFENGC